jgi:hypothetical protein
MAATGRNEKTSQQALLWKCRLSIISMKSFGIEAVWSNDGGAYHSLHAPQLKPFVTGFFTVISIALFAIRFVFEKKSQGMHHGFVHLGGRDTALGFKVHPMPRADRLGTLIRRRISMPRPQSDPASVQGPHPLPIAVVVSKASWRGFFRGLASDTELVLLGGVLAALCGWFVLSIEPVTSVAEQRKAISPSAPLIVEPDEPYTLVSTRARDWLFPAMLAFEPRAPSRPLPERLLAPGATASVEQHALLAEPLFDPLGSVVLSGLPPSSRLSAGAEVSAPGSASSDWAVAFGDLDNLVITLPRDRTGPVQTTLDLRTRAGVKIASLTVELRDNPAGLVAPAEKQTKSKLKAIKASQVPGKPISKKVRPASKAVLNSDPIYPGDAPKVIVSPTEAPKPAAGPLLAAPVGIFKPDPKDSAASGLSPSSRDDPRFTTLRGLGMSPAEVPPGPAPATSSP